MILWREEYELTNIQVRLEYKQEQEDEDERHNYHLQHPVRLIEISMVYSSVTHYELTFSWDSLWDIEWFVVK